MKRQAKVVQRLLPLPETIGVRSWVIMFSRVELFQYMHGLQVSPRAVGDMDLFQYVLNVLNYATVIDGRIAKSVVSDGDPSQRNERAVGCRSGTHGPTLKIFIDGGWGIVATLWQIHRGSYANAFVEERHVLGLLQGAAYILEHNGYRKSDLSVAEAMSRDCSSAKAPQVAMSSSR